MADKKTSEPPAYILRNVLHTEGASPVSVTGSARHGYLIELENGSHALIGVERAFLKSKVFWHSFEGNERFTLSRGSLAECRLDAVCFAQSLGRMAERYRERVREEEAEKTRQAEAEAARAAEKAEEPMEAPRPTPVAHGAAAVGFLASVAAAYLIGANPELRNWPMHSISPDTFMAQEDEAPKAASAPTEQKAEAKAPIEVKTFEAPSFVGRLKKQEEVPEPLLEIIDEGAAEEVAEIPAEGAAPVTDEAAPAESENATDSAPEAAKTEPEVVARAEAFSQTPEDERVKIEYETRQGLKRIREESANAYGIASLPDPLSYVGLAGGIQMPTPGGGNLKELGDLKEFGFQVN